LWGYNYGYRFFDDITGNHSALSFSSFIDFFQLRSLKIIKPSGFPVLIPALENSAGMKKQGCNPV